MANSVSGELYWNAEMKENSAEENYQVAASAVDHQAMGKRCAVETDSGSSSSPSLSFQVVISGIKKMYPAVKNISTIELEELMKTDAKARLVIVDARPEAEFSVSHIPSAIRIDPQTHDMDAVKRAVHDQLPVMRDDQAIPDTEPVQVVMYCSVGYRSSALANRFRQALKAEKNERGDTSNHPSPSATILPSSIRVFNLEGCLFKWANEGREMVDGRGNPTKFVHPYSIVWGQLISRDMRRWEGPST